ncbi:MAG: transglycosylase domain-containing protein [Clostridia bacterium]|nr:transglycosylase domain-containing protein [Clostridia bacterium]
MEDKDLFSYANSNDVVDEGEANFDLNAFSSKSIEEAEKPKKELSKKQKIIKTVLVCFLVCIIGACATLGGMLLYVFTMVDGTMEEDLNDLTLNLTTTVYVDNGKGKYEEYTRLHGMYNRLWVDYDRQAIDNNDENYKGIPQRLANAFIAVEDQRFETHFGVDWKRTTGAVINEFIPIYSSRQGGSTITQQLVKNLTGDDDKTKMRKVREIMRARYLESKYTKDVILECYLNTIAMGHGTYGVQVAANYYFDKDVSELTIAECATLASIPKSPTNYAPDTNPEANKKRRKIVLGLMKDQKLITEAEYNEAINEDVKIVANKDATANNDINSYFIDALITDVSRDLAEKYGYDIARAERLFYNGGYKIYATVDTKMQAIAEKYYLEAASVAKPSSKGDPLLGAMTILNYKGQVKALVGNIGEKTDNRGFNNAIDAVRQPGSTMKPMAVYAPAIENNLINYSTLLNDVKASYGKWSPGNHDGAYRGNITAREALERSTNTIPVALVNSSLGVGTSYNFLTQKLGLKNLTEEDKNLSSLGLGGTDGGVTTIESAAAYAIFGNGGLYYEPTLYTKVTDQRDELILEQNTKPTVAVSEDTAMIMNKMLQNVIYGKNGTGKAQAGSFTNFRAFGKTGTSNDANDKWFVGGTPYYVASSWIGYKTQQKMPASNKTLAAKLWRQVMGEIHQNLPAKDYPTSKYVVKQYYCAETGLLATDACEKIDIGWYKKTALPEKCTTHEGELLGAPTTDVMPDNNDTTSSDAASGTTSDTTSNTSSGNATSGNESGSTNESTTNQQDTNTTTG